MDIGTIVTRRGKRYRVVPPMRALTKDAHDGNWSPAVCFKECGPGGRAKEGAAMRVLAERDFIAQYAKVD